MRIEFDTLKCAKMLSSRGFPLKQAEALVSVLSASEITNINSKDEVNNMLAEAVEKVFTRWDEKQAIQNRESERRIQSYENRLNLDLAEARSHRRWLIGTLITMGAVITTTIIHFAH